MTDHNLDNLCWGCHKHMTVEEWTERHTYHDDGCCGELPGPRAKVEAACAGIAGRCG